MLVLTVDAKCLKCKGSGKVFTRLQVPIGWCYVLSEQCECVHPVELVAEKVIREACPDRGEERVTTHFPLVEKP